MDTYDKYIEQYPNVKNVVTRESFEFMHDMGEFSQNLYDELWEDNRVENVKSILPKHGTLWDKLKNFGKNKAVIFIGAGPSFNINKDVLKDLFLYNNQFSANEMPFIFMASNH